ncbi:MAG: HAD family hydrolase [Bacteroidales bacterium]
MTLSSNAPNKAVFLDRDGVINDPGNCYYVWKETQLRINPGVVETLKALSERGYLLIVITNQGGVGRGLYTRKDVDAFHDCLRRELEAEGVWIGEIYTCPHHSCSGKCLCRKPQPLMIQKALARFRIDPDHSWMVGDSQRDVEAGKAAGLRTLQVESNGDLRGILDRILDHGEG